MNCWLKTGILPRSSPHVGNEQRENEVERIAEMEKAQQLVKIEQERSISTLTNMIESLANNGMLDDPMNANGELLFLVLNCSFLFFTMYISEYLGVDADIQAEVLSDEAIINLVEQDNEEDTQSEQSQQEEQEPPQPPKISHKHALRNLDELNLYLLQQSETFEATDQDRALIRHLRKAVLKVSLLEQRQLALESFFNVCTD